MNRPLYRWKSFWFGVLVITFLGWGWIVSKKSERWVGFDFSTLSWGISQRNCYIGFHYVEADSSRDFEFGWGQTPIIRDPDWFPAAFLSHEEVVRIAHWFLILLFAVPWSGWLAWRWRRMKRIGVEVV